MCESKRYACTEQLVSEVDQEGKFAYKMLDCHILSNYQYKDLIKCKWASDKPLPSDVQEKINELAEKIVEMGADSCKENTSTSKEFCEYLDKVDMPEDFKIYVAQCKDQYGTPMANIMNTLGMLQTKEGRKYIKSRLLNAKKYQEESPINENVIDGLNKQLKQLTILETNPNAPLACTNLTTGLVGGQLGNFVPLG